MNIIVNYLDNKINIKDELITSIEITNKRYFYRLVNDLYKISNGEVLEEIKCLSDENKEINISNNIKIVNNYFDFDFDSKKNINDITKYIIKNMSEDDKETIIKEYKKIFKFMNVELSKYDLPLEINNDLGIESIIKSIKIKIINNEELLDRLFLIIDLEKIIRTNKLIVFINLKQYINKEELKEIYKYSLYNNVKIILIDSQNYKEKSNYEIKLIIDETLDEFMI